jgi:acetyl-CoA acetyltransferase
MSAVAIVGIGMHPFGRFDGVSGRSQGLHAARHALSSCGLRWSDMQFAVGGSVDAGNADTLVSDIGLTGIEFINVQNGCATGGSALAVAVRAIEAGQYDLGMVVGFDKHARGAFNPAPSEYGLPDWYGEAGMMVTTQFFGIKIQRYLGQHSLDPSILSAVAAKAYRNGALNPMAWRQSPVDRDTIAASPMLNYPLTKYMFCSPGEGAVALVLASSRRARQLCEKPVFVKSVAVRSREYGTFEVFSPYLAPTLAEGPTVHAAKAAFELAGVGPDEVQVAQVQDTEAGAEVMHMAEVGLCKHGEQGALIDAGETEIGGSMPINTDGGCIANGEPIGASGLRQIYESSLQLRGEAGSRQVPSDPKIAFTQVYGAPGIAACTVLAR